MPLRRQLDRNKKQDEKNQTQRENLSGRDHHLRK
jgi:hypothetical protein